MEIQMEYRFEAAHRLPEVPENHRCHRLHGHSFRVEIAIRGEVEARSGWLIDFADIDEAFAPLHEQLDHHYLNEVGGLSNPTSENLARWIWQHLESSLPGLARVVVRETCDSACIYSGETG